MKRGIIISLLAVLLLLSAAAVGLFVVRPSVLDSQRREVEQALLERLEAGETRVTGITAPEVAGESGLFGELGVMPGDGTESFDVTLCGSISAPVIGLEMPLAEGTDIRTLRVAAGWDTDSAPIGGEGNCVILGHHATDFGRLDELKPGDSITVQSAASEIYRYTVTGSEVFRAEELRGALEETVFGSCLTLVTDLGSGSHRLAVYAELDTSVG